MKVRLLPVPYDSGARGVRMGAGPLRLLDAGIAERLTGAGHEVDVETIEGPLGPLQAEVATAFALCRSLSDAVRRARQDGRFPMVLTGNCITSVGAIAGLDAPAGVFWLDSHGDFNTPETTTGGFLDGMALAVATGRCWGLLAASVPGFRPLEERNAVLLGTRDLDGPEARLLDGSGVRLVPPAEVEARVAGLVDEIGERVDALYVHLDLDVLDPRDGRANHFAVPDGIRRDALVRTVAGLAASGRVGAAALSAYEPDADGDRRALDAALELVEALVDGVADHG